VPLRILSRASSSCSLRGPRAVCRLLFLYLLYRTWRRTVCLKPTTMADWCTVMTCIENIICSNLGCITGHPDWGFSWYSSAYSSKQPDSTLNPLMLSSKSVYIYSTFCSQSQSVLHNVCSSIIQWRPALSNVLNRVISFPPCTDDGNKSSFRNVLFIVAYRPVAQRWLCKQRALVGNTLNIHERNNIRTAFSMWSVLRCYKQGA
jgi:hypothetical protein